MRENPFWLPAHRRAVGRYEFDWVVEMAKDEIRRVTATNERFKPLQNFYGFTTSFSDQDRLQIEFLKRKMGRKDLEGNAAIEKGATLLYSLGDGGQVGTLLYGAHSELGRMEEKFIFVRVGHYSAHQLKAKLHGDINDLIAYAYVSSSDAEPTFRERARVWFLRHFHPRLVDDKVTPPTGNKWVGSAAEFTMRTMLLVLMKPIGIAIAIAVLLILGFEQLAGSISP